MFLSQKKRKIDNPMYISKNIASCDKKREKKKKPENESDDDDGEEYEQSPLLPFLNMKESDTIYRVHNHIYFRTDVTIQSISKLIKLLNEVNNEFALLESSLNHNAKLTPKPLYLHITSLGGVLFGGLMGMNAIENSRVPVYTIVEGVVASAATLLSIAGKKRLMTKDAYYMIHQLSNMAAGNFHQLSDDQSNNIELMDRLKKIYTEKSSNLLKGKKLDDVLNHDIYWGYETCKRYNLIDGMYVGEQLEVYEDPSVMTDLKNVCANS